VRDGKATIKCLGGCIYVTGAKEDPAPSAVKSVPYALLKNRNFLLFVFSRAGTVTAFQILSVAVGWHVYQRTGEVLNLGLVGLFMFLPVVSLFLVAGFAADRFDRRRIIGACNLLHCFSMAAMGVYLLAVGGSEVWPVFLLLMLSGSAHAFLHPALQATLPNLVPREIFAKAVALTTSVTKAAQLGGPALAGLLIALVDEGTYLVGSTLFLVAGLSAILMRANLRTEGKEPFSVAVLVGGFRHIWTTKNVLGAISMDLVAVLFGGVMGLLPVIAIDILEVGSEALGIMRSTPAVGGLLIATILARSGLPWRVGPAFFLSLAVFGFSVLAIGLSTSFWLTILALAIYGGADMVSVYVRQTLVQLQTPDHLRGRVSAVNSVSINASNQLGDFRGGAMAAMIGAPGAIVLGAFATLVATATWFIFFPGLRKLERF